jgi:pimeloyl-[acyl-carrier protein] methyl ester esterase
MSMPLVCLHGWGMNLRVFDALSATLAPAISSWAIDLPGHGKRQWNPARADFNAQVEDVLACLPERCVLLGWSLGGKFAMRLAHDHSARVAGLVLISSTPRFAQGGDWPHGLDAPSMEAFRHVLQQDWRQTLSDFVWLQLRGSRNAESAQRVLEAALQEHGAPQLAALQSGLQLLGDLDLRSTVRHITQPTLVLSGQHDRVTPVAAGRWLADNLPHGQFAEIARAGHAPFVSHVEEVATQVAAFLAGLRA